VFRGYSMREIKVTVSPNGEVKVSTEGFSGSSCKDVTKDLEKLLGVVEDETYTTEYYLNEENPNYISGVT